MRNLKIMLEIMKFGAKPCGSFYVLGHATPETSDADFYILESQVPAFEAKFLPDFVKENFTNYADEFTVGLYSYESPQVGVTSSEDKSNRIEVTVKKDEYAEALDLMWCEKCGIRNTSKWLNARSVPYDRYSSNSSTSSSNDSSSYYFMSSSSSYSSSSCDSSSSDSSDSSSSCSSGD